MDYAAATPLFPEVEAAMKPYYTEYFGNPSAVHKEGQKAKAALEEARQNVATALGVRSENVTFTGGGTEANNAVLYGLVRTLKVRGVPAAEIEIISTTIEHPSIMEVLRDLATQGVTVKYCGVDEAGQLDEKHLKELLSPQTRLLTFAYVNSEIGTIQEVSKIMRLVKKHNQDHGCNIKVHIDAAQAPLWVSCDVPQLGVDIMTLDTGKCGGPKGVGVLIKRGDVKLSPLVVGGNQESGYRAGTENVPGVVGGAVSLELAQEKYKSRAAIVMGIRDSFIDKLLHIDGVVLNGATGNHRVANNVNISVSGLDTEYTVVALDEKGIAASTKSACSGAGGGESAVVRAISNDQARAQATLRFTLHDQVGESDVDYVVNALKSHLSLMQKI